MRSRLHELPRVVSEPIGTTGAEIIATHVGCDSDGLLRARITISRRDHTLVIDVVRLDREADRRSLIRAALKAESARLAEALLESSAGPNGNGSVGSDTAVEDDPSQADSETPTSGCGSDLLTAFAIESALQRLTESLRTVGLPPRAGARVGANGTTASLQDPGEDPGHTGPQRPELVVRNDLADFADQAEAVLLAMPEHGVYKRSKMLVRIVRENPPKTRSLTRALGAPVIEALNLAHLRDRLARSAKWLSLRDGNLCSTIPPKWVCETLLARGDWPFPRLEAVIETPTLRPDGTILETPGYDEATGLLYEPNAEFPPVPGEPISDELVRAIGELLDPFSEFPFVAESDRCAAIAAVLTLVGRPIIDGPTPLFAIRATTPGTGKGLLAATISLIGTGREPTLFAIAREDEEVRKRLLTIGLEGSRCVLLDNIEGALGSPALAAALTAHAITDRLLGTNRLVTVAMDSVWLATGNNIAFRGDLGRRVLPIDLNAEVEFPEDRKFRREDLPGWVRQQRPRLVVGALTLLRAFCAAGRPNHGQSRMGSFEGWDSVVRAALLWLGFPDPVAGRSRVRSESDTDLEALGSVLEAWWDAFGSEPRTLARAIESAFGAGGHEALATALAALDAKSDGRRPNARPVGDRFRRWKGRIVGGLVLDTDDHKDHGAVLWRVTKVSSGGVGESGESRSFDGGFAGIDESGGDEEK